jgi:hypothetical protein
MRKLTVLLLALLPLLFTLGYVIGQARFQFQLNPNFSTVAYTTPTTISPTFYVMNFESGDGAVCYVLTNKDKASVIESFNQLLPLGCVK